jgi:hypothetical protein
MKRLAYSTAVFLGFALVTLDRGPGSLSGVAAAGADEHGYFDSLVRRADVWKSYSLRDPAQLPVNDALASYRPDADTDRHRQDAAKFVIPAFFQTAVLTQGTSAAENTLTLNDARKALYPPGRVIRIDREVMTAKYWISDTSVAVERGTYGSTPAAHAAGAPVMHSTNSLKSQVRLPLGTEDGHSYFFTWDAYWTDSYVGAGGFNHKAFQFSSGGPSGDTIFFEPDVSFNDAKRPCYDQSVHIAAVHVRSYNQLGGLLNWLLTDGNKLGPGVRATQPLDQSADFCLKPNQWVRFFVNVRQRANDYDYVDMWVADETQDPIQILSNVAISVRPTGKTPNSIQKFWIELNTSTDDYLRLDGRDLVTYVRNFVALRDSGDPRPMLIRPVPGAQAAPGPSAPRNVRIVS